MKREDKQHIIKQLSADIQEYENFYLTDIATLNAEKTSKLRSECFKEDIKLVVVKNTLLQKAFESLEGKYEELYPILKGNTAIMFSNSANAPAKLIKEFAGDNNGKPALKGAFVQDCAYIGADQLETLVGIKSREELIGDIIGMLQAPAQNVISALQSQGGGKIAGIVKTLSEKE